MLRQIFRPFPRSSALGNTLLAIVAVMTTLGTIMIASASEGQAAFGGSAFSIMQSDIEWLIIGVVGMYILAVFPLPRLLQLAPWILWAVIALLSVVVLRGTSVSGGRRWLVLGPLNLQPSEFFKLAVVLMVAAVVSRKRNFIGHGQWLAITMLPVLLGLGLIILGNDIGTTSIVGAIAFIMLIAAGISKRQSLTIAGAGLVGIGGFIKFKSYSWHRFISFLHPNADLKHLGYQLQQSKIGLGAGYLFGLGYGQSREKWGLLPNPHTDFIFSIIGEEFGLVGTLVVVGLFVAFLATATKIIGQCPNDVYRLLAIGVTTWITLEALLNIASVVGFWAITGVPLPFFSYGGSSLIMELCAVGLLINVANQHKGSAPLVLQAQRPPIIKFREIVGNLRPAPAPAPAPERRPVRPR